MAQEYWRWSESRWTSRGIDWQKATLITAGVDVGAISSQAAVMCDGELFCYSNMRTLPDSRDSGLKAMQKALGGTQIKLEDIQLIASTGYGRKNVPFAKMVANEVACHAKGARYLCGSSVRTVVDMGGQATKAIKLYEWDRIRDFMANDKCATGVGWGIEIMADLMQIPIEEMGERSLSVSKDPEPVSTTCHAFANTEAIGLLREGYKESEVLAAYFFAIANRIYTMVGRFNPEKDLALTGGLAKNVGVVKRLEKLIGMTALTPKYDPQLAGAIGAALIAQTVVEKSQGATAKV